MKGIKEKKRSPLKIALAIALLGFLGYIAGSRNLIGVVKSIEPVYFIPLIAISFVLIWLSSVKWQLFIRAWGHDAPVLHLMKIYTITYFYNVFAPSYLMGDLARSFHLGQRLNNQKDAFVTTFLERLTGLLAMVLIGTVFVISGTKVTAGVEYAILSVAFCVVLGSLVCFSERTFTLFRRLGLGTLRALRFTKLAAKSEMFLDRVSDAMEVARKDQPLFFKAMFWSICFHFGTVLNVYIAALAVGWDEPNFFGMCAVVPLVLLVSIAPITPSGLGLQEGAFMFFLQRIGATQAESLAIGLLLRAKQLVTALVGWLIWLNFKSKPEPVPLDSPL